MTKGRGSKYTPGVGWHYLSLGKQFKIFIQLAITFPGLNYAVNKLYRSNSTKVSTSWKEKKHRTPYVQVQDKSYCMICYENQQMERAVSNTLKASWAAIIQLAKLT